MRQYVRWGDRRLPRFLCEPPLNPKPGACTECGGVGYIAETIDEERPDEMWPCPMCREFCKACQRHVKKGGHECKPKETKT